MPLLTQSPSGFVSLLQTSISGLTSKVRNFSSGSVVGAITNAFAAQLLFLQNQAQFVLSVTRASTSTGPDLTSFVSDYFLNPSRNPALSAQGPLAFTKLQVVATPTSLLVGTIVQTRVLPPLIPVQYQVVADVTNALYNSATGAYVMAANGSTITVTAQAITPGVVAGNVLAGTLAQIVTPGVPFDSVSNTADILNGVDAESDVALRARFQKYISGLAKANASSIGAAVLGVQSGLTYTLNDGFDSTGAVRSAYFTVVVDDGSGAIPAITVTNISNAITAVRAAGISYATIAPTNVSVTVTVSGTVIQSGFNAASVRSAIATAVQAYVNTNGVGGANAGNLYVPSLKITYVGIAGVVASFIGIGASQGLGSYSSITVSGGTVDIALTTYQLARAGAGAVQVN